MGVIREWLIRLAQTIHPTRGDDDIERELRGHLDLASDAAEARGASNAQAARAARVRFGTVAAGIEDVRDQRGLPWLDDLLRDLHYGLRTLRRNPGFATVCVLILALGIGANTAVFSVVDTVLLRPLPYTRSDRIVTLTYVKNRSADRVMSRLIAIPDFQDWQLQSTSFDAMAYYGGGRLFVTLGSRVEPAAVTVATPEFFRVFGMQAVAGRLWTPQSLSASEGREAVVSSVFARSHFGDPSRAVGQSIGPMNRLLTIVGVVSSRSSYPDDNDVWFPIWFPADSVPRGDRASRTAFNYMAMAALKPGVSLQAAQSEIATVAARLASAYPSTNSGRDVILTRLLDETVGDAKGTLYLLLGTVGLLLFIASINVGTLLLARTTARAQEIAVRVALGAGRGRIVRQLLVEGLLLSVIASAAGIAAAAWGVRALVALAPADVPRLGDVAVDRNVLLFALAISGLVTLLFALPPALHIVRGNVDTSITSGSSRAGSYGRTARLREAFVIVEIALTVVLLTAAGLLVRSLIALQSTPFGVRSAGLAVMQTTVPVGFGPEAQGRAAQFFHSLLDDLAALPGSESVGAAMAPPGRIGSRGGYWIDHLPPNFNPRAIDVKNTPIAALNVIAPGTFGTLGVPVMAGREFRNSDSHGAPMVAVINASLARQAFGGADPVGRTIICGFDSNDALTIVGVVADVRQSGPGTPPSPECFLPYLQHAFNQFTLNVFTRTASDPAAMLETMEKTAHQRNPDVTTRVTTMDALLAEHFATPRFRALLVGLFGAVALALALAGLYGIMAYVVGQRTQEIGVRMALGATSADIVRMMLRRGLELTGIGLATGVFGTAAATQLLAHMLFTVKPTDTLTYAAVIGLLAATAAVAILIPARRSTHVDPVVALRCE